MHSPVTAHTFSQLLSSTRRGARLARLLANEQFRTWNVPHNVAERAEHIVAELSANAALHGQVKGRDFRLDLAFDTHLTHVLRIQVSDARGERLPTPATESPAPDVESGRGLILVTALADDWGTIPRRPSGKTVWATLHLPAAAHSAVLGDPPVREPAGGTA